MSQEREIRLFIPQGMKAEREWYEGFGKREMMQAVWGLVAVAFIALCIYLVFKNMIYVVLIMLFGGTGTITAVLRSPLTNLSALDHLVLLYHYISEQQKYQYHQMLE